MEKTNASKLQLQEIYFQVRELQKQISRMSQLESHMEKQRLLKLVDAELMDALHNLQLLLEFPDPDYA